MSDEEPRKRKRFIVNTPKKPKEKTESNIEKKRYGGSGAGKYRSARYNAIKQCKKCGSVIHTWDSKKYVAGRKKVFAWNNPDGTPHKCTTAVRNLDPDTLEEI